MISWPMDRVFERRTSKLKKGNRWHISKHEIEKRIKGNKKFG
jgi:hypothetical protein